MKLPSVIIRLRVGFWGEDWEDPMRARERECEGDELRERGPGESGCKSSSSDEAEEEDDWSEDMGEEERGESSRSRVWTGL